MTGASGSGSFKRFCLYKPIVQVYSKLLARRLSRRTSGHLLEAAVWVRDAAGLRLLDSVTGVELDGKSCP